MSEYLRLFPESSLEYKFLEMYLKGMQYGVELIEEENKKQFRTTNRKIS